MNQIESLDMCKHEWQETKEEENPKLRFIPTSKFSAGKNSIDEDFIRLISHESKTCNKCGKKEYVNFQKEVIAVKIIGKTEFVSE
jgi:hypothetical protein